jgi:hypothetical protein
LYKNKETNGVKLGQDTIRGKKINKKYEYNRGCSYVSAKK